MVAEGEQVRSDSTKSKTDVVRKTISATRFHLTTANKIRHNADLGARYFLESAAQVAEG
jgi:hypothetical protein